MTQEKRSFRLLLIGIGPRLGVASLIAAVLWLGFFWATNPLSSL